MRKRIALAAVAATVLAAAVPATTVASPEIARGCGTVKAAGKTWWVEAANVACPQARTLIRRLAPIRPTIPIRGKLHGYPGAFQGMRCVGAFKLSINCVALDGSRQAGAVTHPPR